MQSVQTNSSDSKLPEPHFITKLANKICELRLELMGGIRRKKNEGSLEKGSETEDEEELTHTRFNKCVEKKYKESELNMGENSFIDRCVSKYILACKLPLVTNLVG
ncbi:hypothetical protein UlMin_024051 [Ulmus minor]